MGASTLFSTHFRQLSGLASSYNSAGAAGEKGIRGHQEEKGSRGHQEEKDVQRVRGAGTGEDGGEKGVQGVRRAGEGGGGLDDGAQTVRGGISQWELEVRQPLGPPGQVTGSGSLGVQGGSLVRKSMLPSTEGAGGVGSGDRGGGGRLEGMAGGGGL